MDLPRWLPWIAFGGLLVLTMVCNGTTPTATQATPPPITSAALQPTLEQAQVEVYLETIRTERQQRELQLTLESLYAQQTATAAARQALADEEATRQSRESTATAEARIATATAAAWRTTVEAAQALATATAEAHHATATANAMLFAQAGTATAAAWAVNATATADSLRSLATVQAADAERARLAAERERMVYPLQAYGPWILGGTLFLTLLWVGVWLVRQLGPRLSAVSRDARGDAKILIFTDDQGRKIILDPDRSLGPATTVIDGQVTQPALAPLEYQERVTARDQAVDLAHRGLPGNAPARRRAPTPQQAAQLMAPPAPVKALPGGKVRIIPPQEARAWLDEVTQQALKNVIEGEIVEDEE